MGNVVYFEEINWRHWVIKSLEAETVSSVQSAGIFFYFFLIKNNPTN